MIRHIRKLAKPLISPNFKLYTTKKVASKIFDATFLSIKNLWVILISPHSQFVSAQQ